MTTQLTYQPVQKNNWFDLEKLFESKGVPDYCWCMVWREMEKGKSRNSKSDKKEILKRTVDQNIPIGLLGYDNSEPVAWCSIAPRESYRNLSGDKSLSDVWSLVCFYIKRKYRGQNITKTLIDEAIKFAKKNGAKYVEAYPVEPDSPSYRFMGFISAFEKLGFNFKHKAGKRRHVMIAEIQ